MNQSQDQDYRAIPAYSNSDLSEFERQMFGKPQRNLVKAYAFGSALHEVILEPNTIHNLPENVDLELCQLLAKRVRQDKFTRWALQWSRKENIYLFTDPITGLPCKTKLDMNYKNRIVTDIKSTSQKDYASFLNSCFEYSYDRQAAHYINSVPGAKRFIFIGVQKVRPYDVFYFEATKYPGFVERGHKKAQALLREIQRTGWRPNNWTKTNQDNVQIP